MPASDLLGQRLRLRGGFAETDRPRVIGALEALARRLAGWSPEQVEIEVGVKDRGERDQQVTVEVRVAGWPPLVGHGADRDLDRALREARDDVMRQIAEEKTQRDPTRHRRRTARPQPPPPGGRGSSTA
jgi:hypothetical protein